MKQIDQLKEFSAAFRAFVSDRPTMDIPEDVKQLRLNLMEEELKEIRQAIVNHNLNNLAKELADELYVLLGTALAFGLGDRFEKIFDEVHRSNMSKLDERGQPIIRPDGKVLKSARYTEADLSSLI